MSGTAASFSEPSLQRIDVNSEVFTLVGSTLMDYTRHEVIFIKDRSTRHALRQLLT